MPDFAFIFAGFIVGLVVGLTGLGSGSLMTPLLIFVSGVKTHLAIGSDLLFATSTKLGGTASLARAQVADWRVVGQMALGSISAALVSLYFLQKLGPTNPVTQSIMTTTLGLALLLTAIATLYKTVLGKTAPRQIAPEQLAQATHPQHWTLPIVFGAVIGALVTLTSVGAGTIGVLVLMPPYPTLPLPSTMAADFAHAGPLTLVAGLGHASIGSVDWPLLLKLLVGSLPGIWIGAQLVRKTPDRVIRSPLSVPHAYAGIKLISI